MEAFVTLHQAAREKRDRIIKQAQAAYTATQTRIEALEQDMLGRMPSTHTTIPGCIQNVIPAARTFSIVDVMAALKALDSDRDWHRHSVESQITRLRKRGVIRQLHRAKGRSPAVYALVGADIGPLPPPGTTLAESITEVLQGRSMNRMEIVVALLESGYQTKMASNVFIKAVGTALKREPGRFVEKGGKWVAN